MTAYLIPTQTVRMEHKVKNSRFVVTVGLSRSVAEAKSFIHAIRKEMPSAHHHVYAYIIGHGASVTEGMSDDGEPSGTSGPPILAVLRGSGIGDITLVVSRFFGGTKLGTGGLVSAYSESAKLALAALPTEEKVECQQIKLVYPYAYHDQIVYALKAFDLRNPEQIFAEEVTLSFLLPSREIKQAQDKINGLLQGKGRFEMIEKKQIRRLKTGL
jgi:uncharacterized YigZ family protein